MPTTKYQTKSKASDLAPGVSARPIVLDGAEITPTGETLGYVQAFNSVHGMLPSNLLHDEYLVKTEKHKGLKGYYAAWALEVAVYPANGSKFKKRGDIVDSVTDNQGREWVFPRSSLPNDDRIYKPGIGLIVTPIAVTVNGDRVVIESAPQNVKILQNFMQENGWGRMDEETGVPVNLPYDDSNKRYFWRIRGQGVRPLARGVRSGGYRRGVSADDWLGDRLGVASSSQAQAGSTVIKATERILREVGSEGITDPRQRVRAEEIMQLRRQLWDEFARESGPSAGIITSYRLLRRANKLARKIDTE